MDLQTVKSVINVPIEIEADTFSHYGIEIKSVSFEIEKDNETINFYGEIRPLNGNKIKDDISIVFIFYQKGGNISKIEESHIYSESFFKIDTISDYISFSSLKSLNNFVNRLCGIKIYAKKI